MKNIINEKKNNNLKIKISNCRINENKKKNYINYL